MGTIRRHLPQDYQQPDQQRRSGPSSGRRKSVTRQRSLAFNEKVRVKRIPCQAQVAEGDVADLWFQPQEYEAIKRKTMALIRAVQDDATGGVTYCTRGLERYFSVATSRKSGTKPGTR